MSYVLIVAFVLTATSISAPKAKLPDSPMYIMKQNKTYADKTTCQSAIKEAVSDLSKTVGLKFVDKGLVVKIKDHQADCITEEEFNNRVKGFKKLVPDDAHPKVPGEESI